MLRQGAGHSCVLNADAALLLTFCCNRSAGASVAALCLYDMCKALSHEITICETHLVKKTGGKSDFDAKRA